MSFEIPKTRSEKILQNILGAKNEIEPIQSRIEAILFAILNDTEIGDPYTAPARCEIEKLLVAIKDGGEYNETPLTRSGRILLCKLRGEDYTGTTQSRLEKLFLRWLYELMEITDVPPFTFKSKGNNLIDYDIYGAEDGVGDNESATVSGNPISVSDAIEAPAEGLQVTFEPTQDGTPTIDSEPTTDPYLLKPIPRGNKEYYSLVGGTVAWNQLVQITDFVSVTYGGITGTNNGDGTYTVNGRATDLFDVYRNYELTANRVYFVMGCPQGGNPYTYRLAFASKTDIGSGLIYKSEYGGNETLAIRISNGTEVNNLVFRPQLFDLTALFGSSTIADYIVSLEQAEAGSGIAWLKSYGFFTKDYYPYNEGELISVNTSGHKIGSTTYPIDNIDLRGLFKLSNGKLYCEGDIYPPSGDMSRKYGIVDLGTLPWTKTNADYFISSLPDAYYKNTMINFLCSMYTAVKGTNVASAISNGYKFISITTYHSANRNLLVNDTTYTDATAFKTAMSGQYLVYELATATTESATPYTSPIDVEAGGTEEFIDNRTVQIPVGNETYYASEYAVNGKTGVTVSHGATEDDPNPTEYEVEFTSQGTVYGGTVDIVSGVLSVTWAILSNPQNLNWISNSSQGMKNFQTDRGTVSKKSGSNNWKCSRYSNGFIGTDKAEGIFIFDSGEVCIRDYRYWEHGGTSAEEAAFKASLADVTIAYELAEPQTHQLTPQQVQMLLNDNHLTTPDGTLTLTYKDPNIEVPFSVSCGGENNSYRVDLSDKLYKVGAYADSISYDDQTVKREIEVLRLDGSEEWILTEGVFSATLSERARNTAILCNELTTEQCYLSEDLTTLNITNVPQTSVEEFVTWLQDGDVYVQYVREQTLVTSHTVPAVSTFNGTNTFSVNTEVTPSEVTIIYPNRVTTRTLPKTKKIGKSKLTKSK